MAEIKDKVVTAESLLALHEYNKEAYETKENVASLNEDITNLSNTKFDKPDNNIVPFENGGTGANTGEGGLKNLLADGWTILSSYQYGDTLPNAGTKGRIFFKKLTQ